MAGCQSATQPKGRAKASAKGKAQAAASKGRGKPGSNRKRLTAPSSQSYRSKKRCCARLFAPALPSFSVFPFTLSFLFPFPFPFLCLFFFPLLFTFSFPFFFRSFPSLPFPSILLAFPFTLRFPGLFLSFPCPFPLLFAFGLSVSFLPATGRPATFAPRHNESAPFPLRLHQTSSTAVCHMLPS